MKEENPIPLILVTTHKPRGERQDCELILESALSLKSIKDTVGTETINIY